MSVRRMLPFILVNILVSATVVLAILFWWDNRESDTVQSTAVVIAAPPRATSQATAGAPEQIQVDQTPVEEIDNRVTYVVQPGDTLGIISQQFDILLIDLMEANEITDANFVNAGDTLFIPVIGAETSTPVPTETPNLDTIPSPIPTLPSSGEVVVEIKEVISPGELLEERVTLINSGERQIALSNWQLEDGQGHIYVFGTVTLFGNGVELIVHTRIGQSGLLDLFWGLNEAIWQPGDTVLLRDAEGTVRATHIVSQS
ncbi:MAG: lamin tail domain-containing protein [Candidatus Promineifilaceae bacterium]